MGIVYEAEQISLKGRVGVKILPLAAALAPRHLQRFKKEAEAAANLHHEHVVPVHSVGFDRGIHYDAIQFIDGPPLAAIIQEMRRLPGLIPVGLQATLPCSHAPTYPVPDTRYLTDL